MTINFPHKSMQNFPIFSHSLTLAMYNHAIFLLWGRKFLYILNIYIFFIITQKKTLLELKEIIMLDH